MKENWKDLLAGSIRSVSELQNAIDLSAGEADNTVIQGMQHKYR